MKDNYPLGAKDSPSAPYNQPLDVDYEGYVSVCVSFKVRIQDSPYAGDHAIMVALEDQAESLVKKSSLSKLDEFNIDNIEIIEE